MGFKKHYIIIILSGLVGSKLGHGVRCRVTSMDKVPSNQDFLRHSNNKTEILNFLADKRAQMSAANMIIVTKAESAASNYLISQAKMASCNHKEADTQIFVHGRQAVEEGCKSFLIKANDTDFLSPLRDRSSAAADCLWPRP